MTEPEITMDMLRAEAALLRKRSGGFVDPAMCDYKRPKEAALHLEDLRTAVRLPGGPR